MSLESGEGVCGCVCVCLFARVYVCVCVCVCVCVYVIVQEGAGLLDYPALVLFSPEDRCRLVFSKKCGFYKVQHECTRRSTRQQDS